MRLYDEIFKNTEGFPFARCTVVPGGGGYFEGVKAVGDFSPERVVLCFPRCTVSVEGQGLSIKKYYDGDLQLSGQIFSLHTEDISPKKEGEE
jgi:hypothetical protein